MCCNFELVFDVSFSDGVDLVDLLHERLFPPWFRYYGYSGASCPF
jgi:hypothetical protein